MTTVLKPPPSIITDFTAEQFHSHLYDHYAAYHRDTPVFRNQEGVVYLARHEDCARLLTDKQFRRRPPGGGANPFGNEQQEPSPFQVMINHWMFFMDPPRHDLVRQAFSQPFMTKAVIQLDPVIHGITYRLIHELREQSTVDLISAFAYPLPILVICEILGVPTEDRPLFREWSAQLSHALDAGSADDMRAAVPTSLAIRDYFTDFIHSRRSIGQGGFFDSLAAASKAHKLSVDEMIYGCAFLIWSGHETTKSLIANSLLALCENPVQMHLLRQQPELAPSAIEEFLRYTSPVQKTSRWSTEDTSFGGYAVAQGTLIAALIGAANRDPEVFENADALDLRRTRNMHLAFSKGIHYCLGAALARLEARIALTTLLAEFSGIETIDYRWRANSSLRSLDYLTAVLC